MPRVTIGIPTYNGAERLAWLLRSIALRTAKHLDYQVVVVDDGTPDASAILRTVSLYGDLGHYGARLIRHEGNRGISAGWNTATRSDDADVVVLLNDDVIVPTGGWLEAFLLALEENPLVGTVGLNWHAFLPVDAPALVESTSSDLRVTPRDPGSKAHAPERRDYEAHPPGRVMCATGQAFAFRRADFDALGGFDEGFRSFFEESDFGTRMARDLGKIGLQLNWPMCWHLWSATFGANPELRAGERMAASRRRYIEKFAVPEAFHGDVPGPFDYTNPRWLGMIGPVTVKYLRKEGGVGEAVLAAPPANEHFRRYAVDKIDAWMAERGA